VAAAAIGSDAGMREPSRLPSGWSVAGLAGLCCRNVRDLLAGGADAVVASCAPGCYARVVKVCRLPGHRGMTALAGTGGR
jgi:hypothetical protein